MNAVRTFVVGVVALAALALAGSALAESGGAGAVYTLTNSPFGNAVAVFDRAGDGTLTAAGTYATGGSGTGAGLGSQGAAILSADGGRLYAVNAGSNTIAAFDVRPGGLVRQNVVSSGGTLPISLAIHGNLVYVVNAGGTPTISGFVVDKSGLTPLDGSTRALSPGAAGPAQVSFTPDGGVLVVTEKASNSIDTFVVDADGYAGTPSIHPSVGATPFGFDFDNRGNLLVSDAGGAASSYAVSSTGDVSVITAPVLTHQAAPCWLVATKNGRYAYTANAGAGTISGFSVDHGALTLLAADGSSAGLGAGSHPLDEAVSENGQFLYVLVDGFHALAGFRIADDGSLTPAASAAGLPVGAIGLAAR
jgi:6-phosphogluconolactonase